MIRMQKHILGAVGLFTLISLSQCTFDQIPPGPVEVPDSVSFSLDVLPIFDANCNSSGCHNSGGIPPDLSPDGAWISLVYFDYVDTAAPDQSLLMKKISSGGSMEKFATDQDRAVILKWIETGAANN